MTSIGTLGSVASFFTATLYQGNLIGTTSSGIAYQLRDIYSICRCCRNVATYKWKVHNEKIEFISFVVKFRSQPPITINFEMYVKVWSRSSCICGILYFKLNGIDAINEITKPRIWDSLYSE